MEEPVTAQAAMWEKEGVVSSVSGPECWVEVVASGGCNQCQQSCSGSISKRQPEAVHIRVERPEHLHLRAGDHVLLGIPPDRVVSAAFQVYLLPLVISIAAAMIGAGLARHTAYLTTDGGAILGAALGFVAYFLRLKLASSPRSCGQQLVILRRR